MQAAEVCSLIQSLQGVAAEMDKDTIAQAHKACAVIEKMTLQQCRDVVNRAGSRPCVQISMSDAGQLT